MGANPNPNFFVLVVLVTAVQSQIANGPVNALKKLSDGVTLQCVTISKNCDQVEWSKMEGAQSPLKVYQDGRMLNPLLFPPERYSVNSTGGCSLTITQLKISDSGKFTCSQLIGSEQSTKGCVLVVIGVRESCQSNVPSNTLNQNDSYSFRTAIEVPAKSVEPSNVILSFQNKADGEIETKDESQPLTVKTTLTGIAKNENITSRVCRASLPPNSVDNFDDSTATLDVCTTQQVIVSYPVENVAVSSGPYYKGATVRCTADGYPYPTFKWAHLKSGVVVDGDTLVITGDVGDEYSCIAKNIFKEITHPKTIVVEAPYEASYVGVIIGCLVGFIVGTVLTLFLCWFLAGCPLYKQLHSITDKKNRNGNLEKQAEVPLTEPINGPAKPPRASDPAPNRPRSECNYAELRPEPNPHQMKPNPVNNSSTVYAAVSIA